VVLVYLAYIAVFGSNHITIRLGTVAFLFKGYTETTIKAGTLKAIKARKHVYFNETVLTEQKSFMQIARP
jgi:hypothetical protein